MNITKHTQPHLWAMLKKALPHYRKHSANVSASESGTVELFGGYWDGGSRYGYVSIDAAGNVKPLNTPSAPPQFGGPTVNPVEVIPPHGAIIKAGTFRGRPSIAFIYVNAGDFELIGE